MRKLLASGRKSLNEKATARKSEVTLLPINYVISVFCVSSSSSSPVHRAEEKGAGK